MLLLLQLSMHALSENQHHLCLVNAYLPGIMSQMTVWTRWTTMMTGRCCIRSTTRYQITSQSSNLQHFRRGRRHTISVDI